MYKRLSVRARYSFQVWLKLGMYR